MLSLLLFEMMVQSSSARATLGVAEGVDEATHTHTRTPLVLYNWVSPKILFVPPGHNRSAGPHPRLRYVYFPHPPNHLLA